MRQHYKKCFLKREETENKDDPIGDRCNSFTGFKSLESKFCDTNGKESLIKVANKTIVIPYIVNLPYSCLDTLEDYTSILEIASLKRTDYLAVFEQRFVKDQPENDILHNDKYWTKSIPHENSGPCETYDPPMPSDPGYEISMFLTLKHLDTKLDIFLHEKNKFFYSKNLMSSKFTKFLDLEEVEKTNNEHTRIIGMQFNMQCECAEAFTITYHTIINGSNFLHFFFIQIHVSMIQLRLQQRRKCQPKT